MIPQHIKDRIKKARGKGKGGLSLAQPYLQTHPKDASSVEAVYCKQCGGKIRGMIEDDRYEETRTINGKVITYKKLILACLPGYAEIEIQFDDGSKHITPCCVNCIPALDTDDLEAMYLADLEQFDKDEKRGDAPVRWDLHGAKQATGFRRTI